MDINKYKTKNKLSAKHLFGIGDFDEADIYETLWLAKSLKRRQTMKEKLTELSGKNIALMLGSANSRMRVSFELAVGKMGGRTLYVSPNDIDFSAGLTYLDAITALARCGVGALVVRNDDSEVISSLQKNSPIPVINILDTFKNPCHVLANLFTIWEKTGRLSDVNMTFVGNCRLLDAVGLNAYSKCGISLTLCCPKGFEPNNDELESASQYGDIIVSDNITAACNNADIISSRFMDTADADAMRAFAVTTSTMQAAKPDAVFMHILPVRHNAEVTDEVVYGKSSVVFDQAENLIYTQQALLLLLMNNGLFV